MYDITGKIVLSLTSNNSNTIAINKQFASGAYTIKIKTDKGSAVQKMIIE